MTHTLMQCEKWLKTQQWKFSSKKDITFGLSFLDDVLNHFESDEHTKAVVQPDQQEFAAIPLQ